MRQAVQPPAGLHWPNSGAAPPPTHSHGEEGSLATDQDPTQQQRPGGLPRPEKKQSTENGWRKVSSKELKLSHAAITIAATITALLCCFVLLLHALDQYSSFVVGHVFG